MSRLTRADLDALPAYVPGRSVADLARELGIAEAVKLASNEVPFGPLPGVPEAVADRVCEAVARLRSEELYKLPGVGETITWARALLALDADGDLESTLGVALKVREDIDRVRRDRVLEGA